MGYGRAAGRLAWRGRALVKRGHKKPQCSLWPRWGFVFKRLAIPYFHMANCHTIIGAKRFHFRVRDGIGWFTLAMVTKQFGVKAVGWHFSATLSWQLLFWAISPAFLAPALF